MRKLAILLAAFGANSAKQAQQATPPPPACVGPDFRTLDFWVGEWVVADQQGQAIGTNRITRDEYGQCVITEHFRLNNGTMTGHSVSIYRPAQKHWRQTWVDSQGAHFDLVGGPVAGADHIFQLENNRPTDASPYQRMIWQDVKPDSFTWRWQKRARPEEPWNDSWVLNYKRKTSAAAAN